ncbi:hypothetical protein HanIR_Chr15g0784151 [Helianthus annuus]|nr:hypothetical protein HanIR_Chr15g0784151 [Helianthus annuus]
MSCEVIHLSACTTREHLTRNPLPLNFHTRLAAGFRVLNHGDTRLYCDRNQRHRSTVGNTFLQHLLSTVL